VKSPQAGTTAFLETIASRTRLRVEKAKEALPLERARQQALALAAQQGAGNSLGPPAAPLPFERALAAPGLSFICEVKKASPSKGIIAEDFPWLQIAREYEDGGAAAISVLTEPEFFLGTDQYLREIAAAVQIPVLRKDFVIDPYQLYEAKLLGAQAALLICALLDREALSSFIKTAGELALDCLVEIHNEAEAEEALGAGARIIGINNRDLAAFTVDTGVTARLRKLIPPGVLAVAESGIKTPEDVRALRGLGLDAVLIGESLMRAADRKGFLRELISAAA